MTSVDLRAMTLKRGRKPQNMTAVSNRNTKSSSDKRSGGLIKANRLSWVDIVDEEKGLHPSTDPSSAANRYACLDSDVDLDTEMPVDEIVEEIELNMADKPREYVDDEDVVGNTDDIDNESDDVAQSESGLRTNREINHEMTPSVIKPWAEVTRNNRSPNRGLTMDFLAPIVHNGVPVAKMVVDEVKNELEFWATGLIMLAVGKELSMNSVKKFMIRNWNFVALPNIYYHNDGYFIIRFKTEADRDEVLANGPYSIFSAPIIINKWSVGFSMKEDLLRTLPLWVTFPGLPVHLWGQKSLSRIASTIGIPVTTDECTAEKLRISYARVLIEVHITQEKRKSVTIEDIDGTVIYQPVEYEWLPKFCEKCQKIGHLCEEKVLKRNEKSKAVWIPKIKQNIEPASEVTGDNKKEEVSEELLEPFPSEPAGSGDGKQKGNLVESTTARKASIDGRSSADKATMRIKSKDSAYKSLRQRKANVDSMYVYQRNSQRGRGVSKSDAKIP